MCAPVPWLSCGLPGCFRTQLGIRLSLLHTGPGAIASFPDTQCFLDLLAHLDDAPQDGQELPEQRAARGLFDWKASLT
jgi:hypothetical protein